MDPVSAFGFAVNILTVVDLSLKVISKATEIRTRGNTVANMDTALVAQDLGLGCQKIIDWERRARSASAPGDTGTEDGGNSKLVEIANESVAIAREINDVLDKSKPSGIKWATLRDLILACWGETKLKGKVERLKNLREELQFNVILSMKAKVDFLALKDGMESGNFDKQTRTLTTATFSDGDETRTQLDEHASDLSKDIRKVRELASRNHQETINAIGNLDGKRLVTPKTVDSVKILLNALYFEGMDHRYENVEDAYKKTFEWVFSGTQTNKHSSCTFSDWMKGNNGVYWVSGKAGSGKSTFMKFLVNDNRMQAAFKQWTGQRELVIATYWFWDLGTNSLQKSLEGLYRTLLHTIIKAKPAFASLLFPVQFSNVSRNFPSMEDLKEAFRKLISLPSPPACVGIFIDGLDEFATFQHDQLKLATIDEQFDLIALIKKAATSKNLKIIVSSRPERAFETGFRDCNKLRLHELTYNDQEIYTASILLNHPRMEYLLSHQSEDNQLSEDVLIRSIVSKSEGIFVWLRLVISSLQLALDECDNISDLGAILDKLPKGLDHLFDNILHRIRENDQQHGIEYIRIVQLARFIAIVEPCTAPPITAVGFTAVHSELRTILDQKISGILPEDMKDIVHKVDARLKSTYGLLELDTPLEFFSNNESVRNPEIMFIHKTAEEYLRQSSQANLRELSNEDTISIATSLIKGYLNTMQIFPRRSALFHAHGFINDNWGYINRVLSLCKCIGPLEPMHVSNFIDGLDEILTKLQRTVCGKPFKESFWAEFCVEWHRLETVCPRRNQMLALAAVYGLKDYFDIKIRDLEQKELPKLGVRMLHRACRPGEQKFGKMGPLQAPIILKLLELGVNPNQEVIMRHDEVTTPWTTILQTVFKSNIVNTLGAQQLAEVLGLFIDKGADPTSQVYCYGVWRTAAQIIQWTFIDRFKPYSVDLWSRDKRDVYRILRTNLIPFKELDGDIWDYYRGEHTSANFPSESEKYIIAELGQELLQKLESKLSLANKLRGKASKLARTFSKRSKRPSV